MESNIERDQSQLFPKHAIHEGMPISKGRSGQAVEVAMEPTSTDLFDKLAQLTPIAQFLGQDVLSRKRRYSPRIWQFVLFSGDGLTLLIVFAGLLVLADLLRVGLPSASIVEGSWNTRLLWLSFWLIAWHLSTRITQAHTLAKAANSLRSLAAIGFTLVLMQIFWLVLLSPFLSHDLSSYTELMLIFFLIAFPTFSMWRIAFAACLNAPRFRRQAVVVGITPGGEILTHEFERSHQPIATLLGYISESSDECGQHGNLPILGGRKRLLQLIRSGVIDMIIMAIDYRTNPALFQEVIGAVQQCVTVLPMAVAYEQMSGRIPIEHIGDQWYMSLPLEYTLSPLYLCWRKAIDMVFGLLGTIAMFMLLPLIAALIYLDSPGPIFYSQERLGYRGRPFRILKFRSMCIDAEQAGRATWTTRGDTRVTRFGHLLRATHLDELPQVLNILKGEMSLIGPRPERQEFVFQLEKTIPFYRCRLNVTPGLTGWAQVKYPYASTSADTLIKSQYDLYYIKHQSFTIDVLILLKTIVEVLRCKGR